MRFDQTAVLEGGIWPAEADVPTDQSQAMGELPATLSPMSGARIVRVTEPFNVPDGRRLWLSVIGSFTHPQRSRLRLRRTATRLGLDGEDERADWTPGEQEF